MNIGQNSNRLAARPVMKKIHFYLISCLIITLVSHMQIAKFCSEKVVILVHPRGTLDFADIFQSRKSPCGQKIYFFMSDDVSLNDVPNKIGQVGYRVGRWLITIQKITPSKDNLASWNLQEWGQVWH